MILEKRPKIKNLRFVLLPLILPDSVFIILSPPAGRRWDSKGTCPFGEVVGGAHGAVLLWRNSGEVSPMSKGVFEHTDFKYDYCELRNE